MTTIRIAGRTYQVEQTDEGIHEMNRPGYLLTGPRGARYRTLRTSGHAAHALPDERQGWTMAAPKVWLTDKRGTLEVA